MDIISTFDLLGDLQVWTFANDFIIIIIIVLWNIFILLKSHFFLLILNQNMLQIISFNFGYPILDLGWVGTIDLLARVWGRRILVGYAFIEEHIRTNYVIKCDNLIFLIVNMIPSLTSPGISNEMAFFDRVTLGTFVAYYCLETESRVDEVILSTNLAKDPSSI